MNESRATNRAQRIVQVLVATAVVRSSAVVTGRGNEGGVEGVGESFWGTSRGQRRDPRPQRRARVLWSRLPYGYGWGETGSLPAANGGPRFDQPPRCTVSFRHGGDRGGGGRGGGGRGEGWQLCDRNDVRSISSRDSVFLSVFLSSFLGVAIIIIPHFVLSACTRCSRWCARWCARRTRLAATTGVVVVCVRQRFIYIIFSVAKYLH